MTKTRLILGLIALFLVIFSIVAYFFNSDYFIASIILCISTFLLTIIARSIENKRLAKIILFLNYECNPQKYIREYLKFKKRVLKSKNDQLADLFHTLTIGLNDENLDSTVKQLLEYKEEADAFHDSLKILYLRVWFLVYIESKNINEAQTVLGQIERLIPKIGNPEIGKVIQKNHQFDRLHLNVLMNNNLDEVEEVCNQIIQQPLGKLYLLQCMYNLGLIAYKKNNFKEAKKRFSTIVTNGNLLYIAKKSKIHLSELDARKSEEDIE